MARMLTPVNRAARQATCKAMKGMHFTQLGICIEGAGWRRSVPAPGRIGEISVLIEHFQANTVYRSRLPWREKMAMKGEIRVCEGRPSPYEWCLPSEVARGDGLRKAFRSTCASAVLSECRFFPGVS